MSRAGRTPVLVVLVGPQASGKSTIASALVDDLRARGDAVARVELDAIAEMALPTLPSWEDARRIFGSVVAQWLGTDVACVVAEGIGSAAEIDELLAHVPADARVLRVATTATLETAYARAQADPTRGVSRQRDFLERVYARWAEHHPTMRLDLLLDTDALDVAGSVAQLRDAIDARAASATE